MFQPFALLSHKHSRWAIHCLSDIVLSQTLVKTSSYKKCLIQENIFLSFKTLHLLIIKQEVQLTLAIIHKRLNAPKDWFLAKDKGTMLSTVKLPCRHSFGHVIVIHEVFRSRVAGNYGIIVF